MKELDKSESKDAHNKKKVDADNKDIKKITQNVVRKIESDSPSLLNSISKDQSEELVGRIISYCYEAISYSYEEHYSGPLPSPKILKAYDSAVNNGAERIMLRFESESSHRQNMEKTVVSRQLNHSLVGQILGFLIALCCLGVGCFLVYRDHDVAGITIFSLDIVGLVSVFVIRQIHRHKELKDE